VQSQLGQCGISLTGQLLTGEVNGADNGQVEACRPSTLLAGAHFNGAARSRDAKISTTPRRIASGLLQQATGVITDFSAGNGVLGCSRPPPARQGSRCVPHR
jgi:hypothetical protein